MTLRSFVATFAIAATALSSAASAAPDAASATDYLTGTLGWYDVTQQDNEATAFGLEYRVAPFNYGLRPVVGMFVTTDSAIYGYGGLHWDIALTNNIYLSPNFVAGLYTAGDDGKRLGGAIEFRSGIELAYQMENMHRVGVAFNHISNASIYDRNPGVEMLLVTYSLPVGRPFQ
jgi:lipid A 3-O-deacylase